MLRAPRPRTRLVLTFLEIIQRTDQHPHQLGAFPSFIALPPTPENDGQYQSPSSMCEGPSPALFPPDIFRAQSGLTGL